MVNTSGQFLLCPAWARPSSESLAQRAGWRSTLCAEDSGHATPRISTEQQWWHVSNVPHSGSNISKRNWEVRERCGSLKNFDGKRRRTPGLGRGVTIRGREIKTTLDRR